jgi:hypothetical protein
MPGMSDHEPRRDEPSADAPQQVIIVANIWVTGQPGLVPRFGEPFVAPEARAALLALGWTEPTP